MVLQHHFASVARPLCSSDQLNWNNAVEFTLLALCAAVTEERLVQPFSMHRRVDTTETARTMDKLVLCHIYRL